MQHFLLSLVVLALCNLFTTVPRVVWGSHLQLLAPWATRLLLQWTVSQCQHRAWTVSLHSQINESGQASRMKSTWR